MRLVEELQRFAQRQFKVGDLDPGPRQYLEQTYGRQSALGSGYSTIYHSLFSVMADFGHYVVDPAASRFSRYRHGVDPPARPERREPTFQPAKYRLFEASLDPAQRQALAKLLEQEGGPAPRSARFRMSLSTEQQQLLSSSWRHHPPRRLEYSRDLARRWIFQRTLQYGWSPATFGEIDRLLSRNGNGRTAHKPERWGKKYQWMAFHEFLARMVDNYPPRPYGFLDDEDVADRREIDPTLPPVE